MQVVKALEQILADSYALYFKTQNYHWNVEGAEFRSLHLLFEGQYEDLAESLDELAERIRSLSAKVPALSDLIKLASIDEANPNATANEMLQSLTKDQDIIRDTLYKGLKAAQAESDEGTADMIIGRIKVHEKNRWMLKSSILV
ncbi:DNA starvation/stationary phase protection protein [Rickettsia asiatica]|uniref:DNA starvation/stationary phase protection protein n=2 Tax=spotted fever group TaxID=114277 RepID=A0A510GBF3_9RICK|nr:Dps family protein [Rickettsia asiatica]BBJ32265.1 DNA starvation/stationary phase protection protein [Rickettsia asiatica]